MSNPSFRFVQAADFRLDQAPSRLADVPDHLVEPLIEAPYRAAAGVCDVALAEEADFLLLAGNLVEMEQAGPRARLFLVEQFARLAARGIRVYWATGPEDRRPEWPSHWTWPENVHIFSGHDVAAVVHHRAGQPLCTIAGRSIDDLSEVWHWQASGRAGTSAANALSGQTVSELRQLFSSASENTANNGLPHVAVTPIDWPANAIEAAFAALPTTAVPHFLAIGSATGATGHGSRTSTPTRTPALADFAGQCHTPVSLDRPPRIAHRSGSPQGRSLAEAGPHGCTVVHVDPHGAMRLVPLPTDAVRWHDERITLAADTTRADLDRRLHERMHTLIAAVPEQTLLVRWTIAGASPWLTRAIHAGLAAELTATLRAEFGWRVPAAWTAAVAIDIPSAVREEWFEEQTLLGDYLRAVRSLESSDAAGLELEKYLSVEQSAAADWAARVSLADPPRRAAVLREAAELGAALLRAEETVS